MINKDIESWFAPDSKHAMELGKALRNPHVDKALRIVSDMGIPVSNFPPEGVDFLTFNAMLNASREGYAQAISNLRALAEPTPKQKKKVGENLLQPWQHFATAAKPKATTPTE